MEAVINSVVILMVKHRSDRSTAQGPYSRSAFIVVFQIISHCVFPPPGAESPDAVRKLMSLSDKVRPHNSKQNPLPPTSHVPVLRSNTVPGAGGRLAPVSPRQLRVPAVHLTAESSSVVSLSGIAFRKTHTSGILTVVIVLSLRVLFVFPSVGRDRKLSPIHVASLWLSPCVYVWALSPFIHRFSLVNSLLILHSPVEIVTWSCNTG